MVAAVVDEVCLDGTYLVFLPLYQFVVQHGNHSSLTHCAVLTPEGGENSVYVRGRVLG